VKHLERVDLLEEIGTRLQANYTTTQINSLLRSLGITKGLEQMASSKRVYARERLAVLDDERLLQLADELGIAVPEKRRKTQEPAPAMSKASSRTVFVIHGRNERLRAEFFSFLRAAGLDPLEWSEAVQLTGKAAPYIGEVLDHAFEQAAAVVVLLSPDDVVRLSPELLSPSDDSEEREDRLQPRPNVIFEAGMAFGRNPEHTLIVSVGNPKQFSDVAGRHAIRLNNSPERRLDLLGRLEAVGCGVRSRDRRDWLKVGDFESHLPPTPPGPSETGQRAEMTELDLKILAVVANSKGVSAGHVGPQLEISEVAAEHHLERLEEQELVYARLGVGHPRVYVLDKKGRAVAVAEGLA
jgi:predicted nucleotide-binding protein